MDIKIIETGVITSLNIYDDNGVNWAADLVGNVETLTYNDDQQAEMTQEQYDWWVEYISSYRADAKEAAEIASDLNIDESIIWDRYNDYHTCDYSDHHGIKQQVFEDIKAEYSK